MCLNGGWRGHNFFVMRDLRVVLGLLGVIATLGWCLAPPPRVKASGSTFAYRENGPAYLEYLTRFRCEFAPQAEAMVKRNGELIEKVRRGKDRSFEADSSEFCSSLLDNIRELDGQAVPDVLARAHRKISNCQWTCYESVLALREAYRAQGEERERLLGEAGKKRREADRLRIDGLKEFHWTKKPRQ